MPRFTTFALFASASLSTLFSAAQVQAQDSGAVADEIVVTAQQREQNIQDVPIAVTAIRGDELEQGGVADIRALQTMSPSINLNSSQTESGGTTLRIRGVGTTGNNAGLESAVGVFIDGVYISRPSIALGELLDVEQIEILRGPQGTLFGRNTSAGALTIKTRAPEMGAVGAFGNMTVGGLVDSDFPGLISAQAGLNLPLIEDVLAVRISGAARSRDGILNSTQGFEQNTRDRHMVRGQALLEPNPDMSFRFIADYAEGFDDCCDGVILLETPFVAGGAYAAAGLPANGGVSASGFSALEERVSNSQLFQDPGRQTGFSGQWDWHLGVADLVYIGSWRDAEAGPNVQESDFVGLNVFTVGGPTAPPIGLRNEASTEYVSHEFRLNGEAGPLDWLVGGYYAEEDIEVLAGLSLGPDFQANLNANLYGAFGGPAVLQAIFTPHLGAGQAAVYAANPAAFYANNVSSNGAFAQNLFTQDGKTFSIFTHNTFALTDQFEITVGARYVEEEKHGVFDQLNASNLACVNTLTNPINAAAGVFPATANAIARGFMCFPFAAPVLPGGITEFNRTFEDEELVYTANANFAITSDMRIYASVTHGFKSGGFNLDPTAALGGVADPSFRSEVVDAYEVGLKTEFFDGRWRANFAAFHSDIEDFQVLEFTGVQFQTFNVPKVQATGAEAEIFGQLTDALGMSLAVTYSDARYPSDCAPTTAAPTLQTLCGSPLTNAPEWVGILGFSYDTPVGADHRIYASGSVRYETDRRTSTQPYLVNTAAPFRTTLTPLDIQEANSKTNLRFGWGAQDESWAVEIWGTNIFDEQTRNVTANTPLRGLGAATSRVAFIEEPGIYGVTLRARY